MAISKKARSLKKTSPRKRRPRTKNRLTRRELKVKATAYKGGVCESCGYDICLAALTFHHRNPAEKEFGISDMFNIVNWTAIKKELDKCHLLCSNCHYEVHNGLLDGYIEQDFIFLNYFNKKI